MSYLSKVAALLLLSLGYASLGFAQPPQANPEQQQLYMELVQTSQQIQQLQQQAIAEDEELSAQRDNLVALIDAKMVEIDPTAEALIERRDELVDQLQAAAPGQQSEELQNANAEFQSTMDELQPFQQQALQDSAIQERQNEFQEAAMAVMQENYPEIDNLIARFNEIRNELIEMQQQ